MYLPCTSHHMTKNARWGGGMQTRSRTGGLMWSRAGHQNWPCQVDVKKVKSVRNWNVWVPDLNQCRTCCKPDAARFARTSFMATSWLSASLAKHPEAVIRTKHVVTSMTDSLGTSLSYGWWKKSVQPPGMYKAHHILCGEVPSLSCACQISKPSTVLSLTRLSWRLSIETLRCATRIGWNTMTCWVKCSSSTLDERGCGLGMWQIWIYGRELL